MESRERIDARSESLTERDFFFLVCAKGTSALEKSVMKQ
jgi:hypothetical protein